MIGTLGGLRRVVGKQEQGGRTRSAP